MKNDRIAKCGRCDHIVEGYTRTEEVVIVNGRREMGPNPIVIHPCECVINFPEFAIVEELCYDEFTETGNVNGPTRSMVEFHIAVWDKFDENQTVLEFFDVVSEEELSSGD